MAFDSFGTKAVRAARLGTTPKRCELQLYLAAILQAVPENLEIFRSTTLPEETGVFSFVHSHLP